MKRFGSATWNGDLREGKGSVSTESRALESHPYTFFSRYGEKPGTNPEKLLGAAHAACFTMSFVRLLGMANFVPEQVDSKSEIVIDKDSDGFSITSVHLTVTDAFMTASPWRPAPVHRLATKIRPGSREGRNISDETGSPPRRRQ